MNIVNFTPFAAFTGGAIIGLAVVLFFIGKVAVRDHFCVDFSIRSKSIGAYYVIVLRVHFNRKKGSFFVFKCGGAYYSSMRGAFSFIFGPISFKKYIIL